MNLLSLESAFSSSKTVAKHPIEFSAENTPAQPHALSLVCVRCGAESVQRKNRVSPDVAAERKAARCFSRFNIGKQ